MANTNFIEIKFGELINCNINNIQFTMRLQPHDIGTAFFEYSYNGGDWAPYPRTSIFADSREKSVNIPGIVVHSVAEEIAHNVIPNLKKQPAPVAKAAQIQTADAPPRTAASSERDQLVAQISALQTKLSALDRAQTKPDVVDIVRHLRPSAPELASNYGATIIFRVDYANKTVTPYVSVCWGDQFCREVGTNFAKEQIRRGESFPVMPMPESGNFDEYSGIMHWFLREAPAHITAAFENKQPINKGMLSRLTAIVAHL